LRYYRDIYLLVTEEYQEEPQSGWSVSGPGFELATPEYETRLLTVRSQRFVVKNVKGKIIPVTGREGPYVCETSRLPHFLYTFGSQMAVRLSAWRAGRLLAAPPPGRFLVFISVIG
jgi:hypothetical protein